MRRGTSANGLRTQPNSCSAPSINCQNYRARSPHLILISPERPNSICSFHDMISRGVNLRIMDSSPSAESRAVVTVREVNTVEEYDACIELQRAAFGLPDLEISPRRHLIVSLMAGGWTLGAFPESKLIRFVH